MHAGFVLLVLGVEREVSKGWNRKTINQKRATLPFAHIISTEHDSTTPTRSRNMSAHLPPLASTLRS